MKYSEKTYTKALNALATLRATLPEKEWPTVDFVAEAICEKADRDIQPDHIGDVTTMVAQPDNEPLTLEELRGMGFEWVWIKRIGKHGELPKSVLKYVNGYGYVLAKHEEVKLCDICLRFEEYGKTWLAYRRKPEPEGGA